MNRVFADDGMKLTSGVRSRDADALEAPEGASSTLCSLASMACRSLRDAKTQSTLRLSLKYISTLLFEGSVIKMEAIGGHFLDSRDISEQICSGAEGG